MEHVPPMKKAKLLLLQEGILLRQSEVMELILSTTHFAFINNVFKHFYILGSSTPGDCGPYLTLERVKDICWRRLQILIRAGPDLLAIETIPNNIEAHVFS
ncbi:hypothetical protein ACFE04_018917 [Oxalis oulophora]